MKRSVLESTALITLRCCCMQPSKCRNRHSYGAHEVTSAHLIAGQENVNGEHREDPPDSHVSVSASGVTSVKDLEMSIVKAPIALIDVAVTASDLYNHRPPA